jgi:hypothetical protein
MIPHGTPYNPDVFRCFDLPDESIVNILQYGSARWGTHSFPDRLTGSEVCAHLRSVLRLQPCCKYNSGFFSEIPQKHFAEVQRFDMGNGYVFTAYERIVKTDAEEILFYKAYFADEDARSFPELFSGVLDAALGRLDSSAPEQETQIQAKGKACVVNRSEQGFVSA